MKKKEAVDLLSRIITIRPGAFLRTGYYIPERIIFPDERKTVARKADRYFLGRKIYKLFPFKEETGFIYPINEYIFWFYLNPELEFDSPSYLSLIYSCSDALLKIRALLRFP